MIATTTTRTDFVLAWGGEAAEWARGLAGFEIEADPQSRFLLATRGETYHGTSAGGRRWIALADLIDGSPEAAADGDGFPQRDWRGRFAHVSWDPRLGSLRASTDHFGSLPLYWYRRGGHFAVSTDLRLLLGAPGVRRETDLTAVYHFLNFSFIPAPLTICRDIRRVETGSRLSLDADGDRSERYYVPAYPEDLSGSDEELAQDLRARIVETVQDYRPDGTQHWGCFLSGGTDSSSIVRILAQERKSDVHACSIGFEEAGYDELAFARIAGESCGAIPHLDRVDRRRGLELMRTVVDAYDQPFGNTSAIPTLACAQLGRANSLDTMIGGDGGDEIFGGNQRYAKDKVLEAFYRLPSPVKTLGRVVGRAVGGGSNHLLNRIENFVQRGSLPNPDRFYTDDSFASDHYNELLTPDFRNQVNRDASLEFMREVYATATDGGPLHRIMRLDLLMAIALNDIVKVHGACKYHGVSVRFPYIDPALVEYCGRLATNNKVRGLNKRHLFKQAMRGILPEEILRKRKQGFGVPTAIWLKNDPDAQQFVRDILFDARTLQRGWVNPDYIRRLVELHMDGGWDYSSAIWHLIVLELWMRSHMDAT